MSFSLKDIGRHFGDVRAVDGASIEVGVGEIVCLFGPSGCGKTTLLRIAAGLERSHSGTVGLDGVVLSGLGAFIPPERRPVGFVFQDYVLFPHMTAAENVAFGLNGLPAAERRDCARQELAAAGLEGLDHRRPHELSGGQQQRVALARALARRPRAMLLDEPFASIDSVLRARLREDVRRILKGAGAATILVTHDPDEALALGDRIAIMKDGRIIETARPEDLYARPKTAEGAALFAGAQRFEGRCGDGCINMPFGEVAAPGIEDGPAVVVVLPGALRIAEVPEGRFRVLDARFRGPDWRIALGEEPGARFFGWSPKPIAAGVPADVRHDPALLRIFPA